VEVVGEPHTGRQPIYLEGRGEDKDPEELLLSPEKLGLALTPVNPHPSLSPFFMLLSTFKLTVCKPPGRNKNPPAIQGK
jgi:hypothetical protein